jgi:hypothetical protein
VVALATFLGMAEKALSPLVTTEELARQVAGQEVTLALLAAMALWVQVVALTSQTEAHQCQHLECKVDFQ